MPPRPPDATPLYEYIHHMWYFTSISLLPNHVASWHLNSASLDDRNEVERGESMPSMGTIASRLVGCDRFGHITKSRYSTISSYLSPRGMFVSRAQLY